MLARTFAFRSTQGGAAFSPADLPGVVLFAHPDSGVTLDGSNRVEQWNDASGAANHLIQATEARRPFVLTGELNGSDVYDYQDGQLLVMNKDADQIFTPGVSTDCTISIIYRCDTNNGDRLFYLPETGTTESLDFRWSPTPTFVLSYRNSGGTVTTANLGSTHFAHMDESSFYFFHLEKRGEIILVFFNGYRIHTATNAQNFLFTAGEGASPLAIGARGDLQTPLDGAIGMVLVGTQPLTNAQRASLFEWSYDTFGLVSPYIYSDGGQIPNSGIAQNFAVHQASLNRTYYAYEGLSGEPKIVQYDHATGKWSQSYSIGDTISQNDHNEVTILRLASGKLVAFYGYHTVVGRGKIVRRTVNADDISAWETVGEVGLNVGYPHPFVHDGTLYCLLRFGAFTQRLFSSSDDGANWSLVTDLIDGTVSSSERPYLFRAILDGDLLHMIGLFAPEPERNDVWHAIYDFADGSIRNIDDTHSVAAGSLPITKEDMRANGYLVYDAPSYTVEGTRGVDAKMDASGNIHVCWNEVDTGTEAWHKYTKTTGGADGGSWDTPTIIDIIGTDGPAEAFFAASTLRLRGDGTIDIYAIDGSQATNSATLGAAGNGSLLHYHYDGVSWSLVSTLMAADLYRTLNGPITPEGLPDDIHLICGEKGTLETQHCRVFAFGGAGAPTLAPVPMRLGNVLSETAPDVPANLAAVAAGSTQIDLTWDASSGATYYEIYRDSALLTTSDTNSHSDTGLTPETEYTYHVRAVDALGNRSGLSAAASDTTDADAGGDFVLIDRTEGTNIGSLTAAGGLAAAFDGVTAQIAADCAGANSTAGYVGKTLAAGRTIGKVTCFGSSDFGYLTSTAGSDMSLVLYGKQGSAPANGTDGTILGTITFADTDDEQAGRDIESSDLGTVWDHVWVRVVPPAQNHMRVAELQFYAWE